MTDPLSPSLRSVWCQAERAIARQVKQHMDLVLPSGLIDVTRGPFDKTLLRKTAEVTRTRAEELLTVVVPQVSRLGQFFLKSLRSSDRPGCLGVAAHIR